MNERNVKNKKGKVTTFCVGDKIHFCKKSKENVVKLFGEIIQIDGDQAQVLHDYGIAWADLQYAHKASRRHNASA